MTKNDKINHKSNNLHILYLLIKQSFLLVAISSWHTQLAICNCCDYFMFFLNIHLPFYFLHYWTIDFSQKTNINMFHLLTYSIIKHLKIIYASFMFLRSTCFDTSSSVGGADNKATLEANIFKWCFNGGTFSWHTVYCRSTWLL